MLAQQAPLPIDGRSALPPEPRADGAPEGRLVAMRTRLLDRLGESRRGVTWSGRLEDGSPVAAKRLKRAVTPPALNDLARVANVDRSHLVPVRMVVEERGEQWLVSELADGLSLRELLRRGRPSTTCAVTIAMDVLDGLAELHRAGLWHGAVHAGNVHVGADGTVRLSDYGLSVRGSPNEAALRVADVNGVGMLLCSLLRIPPEAEAEGRGRKVSRRAAAMAASPLGIEARRMVRAARSRRASGFEAVQARLALWEAAGRLANRRLHAQSQTRLAEMVTQLPPPRTRPRLASPAAMRPARRPALPAAAAATGDQPGSGPPRSAEPGPVWQGTEQAERRATSPLPLILALALIAGIVGLVMSVTSPPGHGRVLPNVAARPCPGCRPAHSGQSASSPGRPARPQAEFRDGAGLPATAPAAPVAAAPAAPDATPQPALGPSAAGAVERVVGMIGGCSQGTCALHVEVWMAPAPGLRPVSWEVRSLDLCGGSSTQVGAGSVLAQPGWNHVVADSAIRLTGARAESLVVVTQQPDRAASPLIAISSPGSC